MRRVKINKDLNDKAIDFATEWLTRTGNGYQTPITRLTNLHTIYPNGQERILIDDLIGNLDKYILAKPNKMAVWARYYDINFSNLFWHKPLGATNYTKTTFCNDLIHALRYDSLQSNYAGKIGDILGTKACIYCNAQLAVVVDKSGERKARYELDHFFPKSRYPFLSTSFYNLVPACSNCNGGKSNKKVSLRHDFHLYTEGDDIDQFRFLLSASGLIRYWQTKNRDEIVLAFQDNYKADTCIARKHNSDYAIMGIYNTQKDIAEELIHKSKAYTKAKKRRLRSFKKLFADDAMLDRIIAGNYVHSNEIHLRPMAKYTQDIARQLGLID